MLERIEDGVSYKLQGEAVDNGDGSYYFVYRATSADSYVLSVRLVSKAYPAPGEFITDSPWFNVRIHPAPASSRSCIASGTNLMRTYSGASSSFTIKAFDPYGNARTTGGGPLSPPEPSFCAPRAARRPLLMPQVHPGSLYRCGEGT